MQVFSRGSLSSVCAVVFATLIALQGLALPATIWAVTPNMVTNGNLETATGTPASPTGWTANYWGNNTRTFNYQADALNNHYASVTMTQFSSGDAKWVFAPVSATANQTYTFSDSYQSNAATELDAEVTLTSGAIQYIWIKDVPASTNWTTVTGSFTTPANTAKVTVYHLIAKVGTLSTDNYSLTNNAATPTPTVTSTPLPTVSPTPTPTPSITPTITPTIVPTPSITPTPVGTSKSNLVAKTLTLTNSAGQAKSTFAPNEAIYVKVVLNSVGTQTVPAGVTTEVYANQPTAVAVGSKDTPEFGINHTGSWAANGSYAYGSYPTGTRVTQFIGSTRSFKQATPGTYTARVFVDAPHIILETNEIDNQLSATYTVVGPNPTPTPTITPTATPMPSPTASPIPTVTPTITPTPSATPTPTATPTSTPLPSPTMTPAPTPTVTPLPSLNLIVNPSLETATTDGANPQSWGGSSWGTLTPIFSYLTGGAHTGNRSAKVQITSYTSGDAKWYFTPQPILANAQYQFSDWYQSNVASQLVAEVKMTNGTYQYILMADLPASTTWKQTAATVATPVGAVSMSVMHVILSVGWLTIDDASLTEYHPAGLTQGMVSLTFDDATNAIYNNGLPLLTKYGFKSTQYIMTGPVKDGGDDYYMTPAMVLDLFNKGHEIASHTVNHPHMITMTAAQIDKELADSKTYLTSLTGVVPKNFATPYGEYNATVQNEIKKYYQSHRTVDEGYNSPDSFSPYTIKIQHANRDVTPATIQSWINYAKANKVWLVIMFHEIKTGGDEYSYTPTNLENVFKYLQSTGSKVVTVQSGLDIMASAHP